MHLQDTANNSAIGKHVVVVIIPLARWAARRGALEDQRGHGAAFNCLALAARMDQQNFTAGLFSHRPLQVGWCRRRGGKMLIAR